MGLGPNIPSTAGPDTPTMLVLRDAPYFLGVLLRGKGLRSRLLWSDEGNMRGLRLRHCLPSHIESAVFAGKKIPPIFSGLCLRSRRSRSILKLSSANFNPQGGGRAKAHGLKVLISRRSPSAG